MSTFFTVYFLIASVVYIIVVLNYIKVKRTFTKETVDQLSEDEKQKHEAAIVLATQPGLPSEIAMIIISLLWPFGILMFLNSFLSDK